MKNKLSTPKDKIEFAVYILQILLFIIAIIAFVLNTIFIIYSLYIGTFDIFGDNTVSLILSIGIGISFFTSKKLKEIRYKFKKKGNK